MRCLLVDNDPVFLKLMEKILFKEGHEILTAPDGLSALDILQEFVPDFIFVDYVMPNISGSTLCRILRKKPALKDSFIVILSAVAAEDWASRVLCDADAYIAKTPLNNIKNDILNVIGDKNAARKYCSEGKVIGIDEIKPRVITRELLTSASHYNSLLNQMSEGILELNRDRRIVYANPSSLAIFDIPEHDILGKSIFDLFTEEQRDRIDILVRRNNNCFHSHDEDRLIHSGKKHLAVNVTSLEGCNSHSLVIIEDITDLKTTEISLQDTNIFLNSILDSSHSYSIVSTDLDQNIIFWNKGAEKMFGYTAEEMVGKNKIRILYPDEEIDRISREIASGVREKRDSVSFETREITKNGEEIWVKIHLSPRVEPDGKVVGILGIGEDITELKKIEEEKEELQNQVLQSRKSESIGTLAGGVAHDFNNLLMGIQGHISIAMLNAGPDSPLRENLKEIEEFVIKGANLTDRLLNLAKGAKGPVSQKNLNALIQRALKDLDKDKKDVEIETDLAEDLWKVDVTETQMIQVFLNLFANAVEAMNGQGSLIVKTENRILNEVFVKPHKLSAGKYVGATVEDTGIGMDQQTLEKIFDPFFTTRFKGPKRGSGLGLATVYATIKNHKGMIKAKSSPGKGTIFELFLPVSKKEQPKEQQKQV